MRGEEGEGRRGDGGTVVDVHSGRWGDEVRKRKERKRERKRRRRIR